MEAGRDNSSADRMSASGERSADPYRVCPRCSQAMKERACKLICARCGYYLSCSDF